MKAVDRLGWGFYTFAMNKPAMRMLLLVAVLALPAGVRGQDYRFKTNNNAIIITRYTGHGGAVTIPCEINGLPVTSLWDGAFVSNPSLTSVAIPSCITSIGGTEFGYCTNLASVTILNGVTSIGYRALVSCEHLTSIIIPNSVTNIGTEALSDCANLSNITISASVTKIGIGTFRNCYNLTGIKFNGNAPRLGVNVFNNCTNATIYYLPGTTGWGKTFGGRPTAVWKP